MCRCLLVSFFLQTILQVLWRQAAAAEILIFESTIMICSLHQILIFVILHDSHAPKLFSFNGASDTSYKRTYLFTRYLFV